MLYGSHLSLVRPNMAHSPGYRSLCPWDVPSDVPTCPKVSRGVPKEKNRKLAKELRWLYERCLGYVWGSPVLLAGSKDMLVDVARHRSRSVVGHSVMVTIAPTFS